jgi:ethanolamine utilization protein EutN
MSSPARTRMSTRFCRRRSKQVAAPRESAAITKIGGALPSRRYESKNMFLAKVEGSVVATKKDPNMSGRKLLLLRPQLVDEKDPTKFRPGMNTVVAVDSVGAGIGEMVMFCQGSSARLAPNLKECPVDAVIIGIVDTVDVFGKEIFSAKTQQ